MPVSLRIRERENGVMTYDLLSISGGKEKGVWLFFVARVFNPWTIAILSHVCVLWEKPLQKTG